MLSVPWRESALPLLEDGQQPATLASLLYVDSAGQVLARIWTDIPDDENVPAIFTDVRNNGRGWVLRARLGP